MEGMKGGFETKAKAATMPWQSHGDCVACVKETETELKTLRIKITCASGTCVRVQKGSVIRFNCPCYGIIYRPKHQLEATANASLQNVPNKLSKSGVYWTLITTHET